MTRNTANVDAPDLKVSSSEALKVRVPFAFTSRHPRPVSRWVPRGADGGRTMLSPTRLAVPFLVGCFLAMSR